mgnify:CR=1 FL=1
MASPDPIREQSLERSLPNSAEAERAILGGIILDNGLISQAIELCGGRNVFADLPALAAPVNREALLARDPQVIIVTRQDDPAAIRAFWRRGPGVAATRAPSARNGSAFAALRFQTVTSCPASTRRRAIGAPINIWNDHTDSMSMRDAGWLQIFAESNQEALDLHIQAFKLAEELSMPVMVCMDGFILTHAYERVDMPAQAEVDAFLPPYEPRQVLDPADPVSIGAMVGPEAFMEVRYLAHAKQRQALELMPSWADEFRTMEVRATSPKVPIWGRPEGP